MHLRNVNPTQETEGGGEAGKAILILVRAQLARNARLKPFENQSPKLEYRSSRARDPMEPICRLCVLYGLSIFLLKDGGEGEIRGFRQEDSNLHTLSRSLRTLRGDSESERRSSRRVRFRERRSPGKYCNWYRCHWKYGFGR